MQSSASHVFLSIAHDLITFMSALRSTVIDQLEQGMEPQTVNYLFKGRLSSWYSQNHMKIVSTAHSLCQNKSNLAHIGKITVSAYTGGSGMTRLTKGAAFKTYIEFLPAAMSEIGRADLGTRALSDFESIQNLISESGQASESDSKQRKQKTLISAQIQAADALYEQILSDMSEQQRHELRQQTARADNKLTALMGLLQAS
jgi:hypothetical protein